MPAHGERDAPRTRPLFFREPIAPFVIAISTFGTFSLRNNLYDFGIMVVFGIGGYVLDTAGIRPVPLTLGLVLGDLIENNFEKTITVSGIRADSLWQYLLRRPIALDLMPSR